jgi:uncharacterized repeat protein (TIGR01451 family)
MRSSRCGHQVTPSLVFVRGNRSDTSCVGISETTHEPADRAGQEQETTYMAPLRTLIIGLTLASATAGTLQAQNAAATAERQSPLALTATNKTAAAEAARGAPRADQHTRPGDVLRYSLTFTNNVGQPVRGMTFTSPLAGGLQFEGNSIKASRDDARVSYSADGGSTYSQQPMEEVVVDGKRVKRPVDPSRYTHVRWTVDGWLAPDAAVTAEYSARLAPQRAAAASESATSGR